jgi:hypothetical protein
MPFAQFRKRLAGCRKRLAELRKAFGERAQTDCGQGNFAAGLFFYLFLRGTAPIAYTRYGRGSGRTINYIIEKNRK